jgi:hypothetical protein
MASTEKTALTPEENALVNAINYLTRSGHHKEKSHECSYREGLVAKLNEHSHISPESITKVVDEVCKGFPQHPRPSAPSDVTIAPNPSIPNRPSSIER